MGEEPGSCCISIQEVRSAPHERREYVEISAYLIILGWYFLAGAAAQVGGARHEASAAMRFVQDDGGGGEQGQAQAILLVFS
jgi:hypothetical protein